MGEGLGWIAENLRGLAVPVTELHADPANARTGHDVRRIAESLKAYGQRKPLVANRAEGGKVEAGNGTLAAALKLGWTHVAVVWVDDDPATAAAFGIADNRTGELSRWDADALGKLAEVTTGLFTAFEGDELAEVLGAKPAGTADAEPQVDRAAELNEKWQVQPGDLWRVGEHRLICGDCTDASVVARVMGGEKANMLFTSPPYWVGKDYEYQSSEDEIDKFILNCVKAWTDSISVDYGKIIINTGSAAIHRIDKKRKVEVLPLIDKWQKCFKQRGWIARHFRIWAKSGDFPASIAPESDVVDQRWEHLVTFTHDKYKYMITFWSPSGDQRGQERVNQPWAQQGVWSDIQGDRSADRTHIAAFPEELPRRYLMLYSQYAEIMLEPFLGSGTTMVACENLGRRCRAVEIAPGYCAVALERMATAFPGIVIERVGAESG